ncbi:hypothetical protein [Roseimarinus sediminis]|uniref:hypothetical protein n=1 Tax=Roseimarinus sediminis TaxID=1610899 RepID=UPI003D1E87CA
MKFKILYFTTVLFISALMALFSSNRAYAQVTESRTLTKGFEVDKSTIVDIENKYGDVSIETWDKDSVWVEIVYEVSEKNYDRLDKKMKEISFELTQSGHYVVVSTIIGSTRNMLLGEINKLKESIGMAESQVKIDIRISLPDQLDLRIKNKFGNIYLDDYNGDVSINLSNGRLKAHDLTGYSNLTISFSDAIINSIDTGSLEIYYSEMNLTAARKLRITSKTSDITITEVKQMLVNSSRDDYRIRMIADFETQASWTDFAITEFSKQSDIKMNYGELTIEKIQPTMEQIVIDARSTKINLFFSNNMDVNFDIITDRDLNLPMEATIDSTVQMNTEDKVMRYIGRTGNIDIESPTVILKTESADISILKR